MQDPDILCYLQWHKPLLRWSIIRQTSIPAEFLLNLLPEKVIQSKRLML